MDEKYLYKVINAAIIFNSDKRFLLAKRSMKDDILPGYWGIPGGKVESKGNIPNILEHELKREIKEEVGVEIKNLKYIESHLNESGKLNICFACEISKGEPKPLDETEEVGWFTLEQAEKMQLTPHTLERLKLACKK
jgi:8-oxo-dGTP pyrophosphatase MutT (NUDIX family)